MQQPAIYSYERKRNPGCMTSLHCECQEPNPKAETHSSFSVLHPFSGVDAINAVGSHLMVIPQKLKLPMNFFETSLNVIYQAMFRKTQ